jgi:hypothetical protein
MLQRWPALFLAIALLSGCAGRTSPKTAPDATAAPSEGGGRISSTLRGDVHLVGGTLSRTVRVEIVPDNAAKWTYLGSLAVVSAILESRKEQLRRDVLTSSFARHSGWTDFGGQVGQGRITQGAAVLLYGGGLLGDNTPVRQTGLLLGESYAMAQIGAGILNFTFSERRPEAGGQLRFFHSGSSSTSIHMTNTVVLAEVLDHQVTRIEPGDGPGERAAKILGKVLLYAVPTVTAWQRMRSDQHYAWNVVLGAGQSFYVTSAVLRAHDAETGRSPWLPQLAMGGPGPGGRGESMVLDWRF